MPLHHTRTGTCRGGRVEPTHGRAAESPGLACRQLFTADPGSGEFFMTWGYHPYWHGEVNRQDLDAISATRPIYISHRSFHEGIFNTAALNLLKMMQTSFRRTHKPISPRATLSRMPSSASCCRSSTYLLPPAAVAESMRKTLQVLQAGGITTVADMSTGSNWAVETAVLAQAFDHAQRRGRAIRRTSLR